MFLLLQLSQNADKHEIKVLTPQEPLQPVIETQQLQTSSGCSIRLLASFLNKQQLQLHQRRDISLNYLAAEATANDDSLLFAAFGGPTKNIRNDIKLASLSSFQSDFTTFSYSKIGQNLKNRCFKAYNIAKQN